eukprot:TRINITY_DN8349_c0_g1_i2.p1 TRINITY_DN8349_c0_g1~~TRINITY_DN8349_c0_g1_i2.p1  ORF type:complete len:608 (+),score=78.01 TRINITY_DN8349_c0_g1_i2:160-1983(+)
MQKHKDCWRQFRISSMSSKEENRTLEATTERPAQGSHSSSMEYLVEEVAKNSSIEDYQVRINSSLATCEAEALENGNAPPKLVDWAGPLQEEQSLEHPSGNLVQSGSEPQRQRSLSEVVADINGVQDRLAIAIMIVGTRGDVQPFIAIGRRLKELGHRVRLATHAEYRSFVVDVGGLEFFPLGGDPHVLAEYLVRNKGILPGRPADIPRQREQLRQIIFSTWPACTEPDTESNGAPFRAEAIIANPPTMSHTHIAEALQVPLHVFFTMPWTPTREWPHPFARVTKEAGLENYLSYYVVENFVALGLRDIINDFRKNRLQLAPLSYLDMAYTVIDSQVPMAYIWSPSLAPKPSDWGPLVDVVGFCFLDLATKYEPPSELVEFLRAGSPPVFIGFGSLPVQDPKGMTETIVRALEVTGQRGIIQRGSGGLGELSSSHPYVFTIGDCPHDWLFPRCSAAIHHGGAGTTAAGILAGLPTCVVPIFGDQYFWGKCCAVQGVGPEPIPMRQFDMQRLVKAIKAMQTEEIRIAACQMSEKLKEEDGVQGAVEAFHRHLGDGVIITRRGEAEEKKNRFRSFSAAHFMPHHIASCLKCDGMRALFSRDGPDGYFSD